MRRSPYRLGPAKSRGLAAVELTFVLPVFLMLLMACGELGRAIYQYNTLVKAIRDGAQYLGQNALLPATGVISLASNVTTPAKNMVVYGNAAGSGSPLLPDFAVGNVTITQVDSTHVQINASYAYEPMFSFIPTFGYGTGDVNAPGTLSAGCVVRAL